MRPHMRSVLSAVPAASALVTLIAALLLIERRNYLLFHSLAESFSIVIAGGIFMVAWNTRRFHTNGYLLFIGMAYLFVGLVDLLHMLAFRGMGVFAAPGANLATQLWLAARYIESVALLIAPAFAARPLRSGPALAVWLAVTASLLSAIFGGRFPTAYVDGAGLTAFKIGSEYAICVTLAVSLALLHAQRRRFDPLVWRLAGASVLVTIASELCFTLYHDPYQLLNGLGHAFKIVSVYLIYKAIIETGLSRPYALLFRDLKRREGELEEARAAADRANSAKDRFLAVLSHELRTPLNPVLLAASSLRRRTDLPREVQHELEMIRRNTELEQHLIEDLLNLTRIAQGKLRLDMTVMDADEALRHAIEICRSEGKRLTLRYDAAASRHHVRADPARLKQIFWNLIKNAIKFTPEGGTVTVRTCNREAHDGNAMVVEVIDTGIGMPPEVLEHVFQPFEQASPEVTRRFGGLGLGLAITRSLVEMHGGTVRAFSEGVGRGATFRVEIPTCPTPARMTIDTAAPAQHRPPARRLSILLVEDHADTAMLMARLLRSMDHEVHAAGAMQSALDAAAQARFDLVISDLGLPDGSGLDLMRQLRERHNLRGICLSGYGTEQDAIRSREAGFAFHLVKPLQIEQLTAAIERMTV